MKYGVVEKGEKTVYTYRFDAEDNEEIADDESGEAIQFEVDDWDSRNFRIQIRSCPKLLWYLPKYCYCYFPMEAIKKCSTAMGSDKRSETFKSTDGKLRLT